MSIDSQKVFVELFRDKLDSMLPFEHDRWLPEVYEQLGILKAKRRAAAGVFRIKGSNKLEIWIEDPRDPELRIAQSYWQLHLELERRLKTFMHVNDLSFPIDDYCGWCQDTVYSSYVVEGTDGRLILAFPIDGLAEEVNRWLMWGNDDDLYRTTLAYGIDSIVVEGSISSLGDVQPKVTFSISKVDLWKEQFYAEFTQMYNLTVHEFLHFHLLAEMNYNAGWQTNWNNLVIEILKDRDSLEDYFWQNPITEEEQFYLDHLSTP